MGQNEEEEELDDKPLDHGYVKGNVFGGLLSFTGYFILVYQFVYQTLKIFDYSNANFAMEHKFNDDNEVRGLNLTFGNFNRSMHFAFGCADQSSGFDPLNNPYFDVVVYRMRTGEILEKEVDYDVRKCQQAELDMFVPKSKQKWYPNALCLNSRDAVSVKGNWFMDEYDIPTIALARCETSENRTCADDKDFQKFIKSTPFFFIGQQMHVIGEMFSDHKDVLNDP